MEALFLHFFKSNDLCIVVQLYHSICTHVQFLQVFILLMAKFQHFPVSLEAMNYTNI